MWFFVLCEFLIQILRVVLQHILLYLVQVKRAPFIVRQIGIGRIDKYTLRLKAALRTAPQFRNDGKAAFAKLLGFGALPRI